jgi:hypothetical protein
VPPQCPEGVLLIVSPHSFIVGTLSRRYVSGTPRAVGLSLRPVSASACIILFHGIKWFTRS